MGRGGGLQRSKGGSGKERVELARKECSLGGRKEATGTI